MEANIKNIDLLPEEVRENFKLFLDSALDEDAQDSEFRSFLINFLDNENGIDANEIWGAELTQDRFLNYVLYQNDFFSEFEQTDAQEAIIETVTNPESEFETLFSGDDLLSEFSDSATIPEPPPFDIDTPESEIPQSSYSLPESNLDVPPSFDEAN